MSDVEVGPGGRTEAPSPLRRVASALGGLAFVPVLVFAFGYAPSCMGFGAPALAHVNACPRAVALLGAPIAQPWIGLSCGNAETEDDDGQASWSMPVSGPRGRGTLDIRAIEHVGHWQFRMITLSAGGHEIDVLACEAGGTGDVVPIPHRVLAGTVTTIVGEPGVSSGQACTVTIDPANDVQNCRVVIACGARTLYGEGTGGYGHCGVDASGAITMRDGNPSATDDDPMIDLRASEVVVTDQGRAGTWVATVSIAR